jgi:hypothetical protein
VPELLSFSLSTIRRLSLSPVETLNVCVLSEQGVAAPAVVVVLNEHVIEVAKSFLMTVTVSVSAEAPPETSPYTVRLFTVQALGAAL